MYSNQYVLLPISNSLASNQHSYQGMHAIPHYTCKFAIRNLRLQNGLLAADVIHAVVCLLPVLCAHVALKLGSHS